MTAVPLYGKATQRCIAMLSIHSSPLGPLGTMKTGGMSVYVRELSRWLGRMGHRIDIFTCAGDSHPDQALYPNVRLIRLPTAPGKTPSGDQWSRLLPDVFDALDTYRRARERHYDLIHSHYWVSAEVGVLARQRWQVPHLIMFHTLGAVKNNRCVGEKESDYRIARERRLVSTADAIVLPVVREREHLIHHYHARRETIRVVPCGVDLDLFRPGDREQARRRLGLSADGEVLLYVGRFVPLKGLERLLEAVALLRPRLPNLNLLMVGGDGDSSPAVKAQVTLAERLGIADAVRFVGRVTQNDLPRYYQAADLLVMPSHYESFGLVVLEALACGIPVAATPVGVVEQVVQPGLNGAIAGNGGPPGLADTIASVLGQSRRRRVNPDRIRATVADFGWPRIAAAMTAVYNTLPLTAVGVPVSPMNVPGGV